MEVVNKNPYVIPIFNYTDLRDSGTVEKQNGFIINNPQIEDIMANCIAEVKHSTNLTYMFSAVWCKLLNQSRSL